MATPPPDEFSADSPPPNPAEGHRKHRHRVAGDSLPFPVALLVVCATLAASIFVPRRWLDTLALLGLCVVALAADLIIRAKARALAVTIGVILAYVGIVADGDWRHGIAWTAVPFVVLGWLTIIIGFRALLKSWGAERALDSQQDRRDDAIIADLIARIAAHDERAIDEGMREVWPRIRSTWRLGKDVSYLGWRRTPAGGRVGVRTAGDAMASVSKSAATIAARVGLPRDAVTVTGDTQDASVAHVNIRTRDRLDLPAPWTPPQTETITKGCRLMIDETGNTRTIPLTETHVQVTGKTRAGKTSCFRVIGARVATAPDAMLVIVDVAKGAHELTRLWPHAFMVGRTIDEAHAVFDWITEAGRVRGDERAAKHVEGTHRPTKAAPQIVLLVDELPAVLADKDLRAKFQHLVMTGSGWGLTVVYGITTPHAEILPTYLRGQVGVTIGYAGAGPTYHKLVFHEPARPGMDSTELLPQTGRVIVRTDATRNLWHAKVVFPECDRELRSKDNPDGDVLVEFLASVPESRHRAPHPMLGPAPDPDQSPDPDDVNEPAPVESGGAVTRRLHVVEDVGPDPDDIRAPRDRSVYEAVVKLWQLGGQPIQAAIAAESARDVKTVRKALGVLVEGGWLIAVTDSTHTYYRPARTSVTVSA